MKNIWPKHWQFTKLQDVATAMSGCAYPLHDYPSDDRLEVVTIDKFTDSSYTLHEAKYMKISDRELMKFKLRAGDIIFCHRNSSRQIGKSICFTSDEQVIHTSKFIRIRVSEAYDSHFLEYVLSRYKDAGIMNQMANQNDNLRSITLLQLNNLPVPALSLIAQKNILDNVIMDSDNLMAF